jgi:hypothetical protein
MTQTQAILEYLNKYGTITPIDALRELGCFRLAARIHELEQSGYNIPRRTVTMRGKKTGRRVHFTEYMAPVSIRRYKI